MSLQTWKDEFYPIPASEVSEKDALDHFIKKWEGLRKDNLEKHGLVELMIKAIKIVKAKQGQ